MTGKVAVMGAGSWGTAFALICCDAGRPTHLWARRREVADEIQHDRRNSGYLPGIDLPSSLEATDDPQRALDGADVVILAVPSVGLADQLRAWGDAIAAEATLASLVKGVDVDTLRTGSRLVRETLDCDPDRVVVVSGPNIARECAQRLPAGTVAACPDEQRARDVLAASMTPYFRVYTNPDRVGCETGGAVKNVIALAAGMADGMGLGKNTKATLVTRGLAEMTRLGVALGGRPLTFLGLAGVGDLVVTCTSEDSRNRTVGERLGRGELLDDIIGSMNMVAEGVKSSQAILRLADRSGIEMPITAAVVGVIHHGGDPRDAVPQLMTREPKPEMHGLPDDDQVGS
ncbi:MAG TPA: NAD(P)H-dependent glycerol-3-phosphate dehydrogenase [Nitriliruptorales bacterium]|nr:NAD(P)H-dependent glycerol-3-phosphate dehydrogenase [Nitriliruptorales bacterium]